VTMDFIPSLPKTPRGYDGILLVVDTVVERMPRYDPPVLGVFDLAQTL
jgi:hypothetical protein